MQYVEIEDLIRQEQKIQLGSFIGSVDIDEYLSKIKNNADIVTFYSKGKCVGFIAFYCNDEKTKQAFITLVLIEKNHRGMGLSSILMDGVVKIIKKRGFKSCKLEVKKNNMPAIKLYSKHGFKVIDDLDIKHIMDLDIS